MARFRASVALTLAALLPFAAYTVYAGSAEGGSKPPELPIPPIPPGEASPQPGPGSGLDRPRPPRPESRERMERGDKDKGDAADKGDRGDRGNWGDKGDRRDRDRGPSFFAAPEMEAVRKALFAMKPEQRDSFHKYLHQWGERARKNPGPDSGDPVPEGAEFDQLRKAIREMPAETRKRFLYNTFRWSSMSPKRQEALMDLAREQRAQAMDEAERAIKDMGLPEMKPEARQRFIDLYVAGRQQIEMELMRELDERRRPRVSELRERLRQEFGAK